MKPNRLDRGKEKKKKKWNGSITLNPIFHKEIGPETGLILNEQNGLYDCECKSDCGSAEPPVVWVAQKPSLEA